MVRIGIVVAWDDPPAVAKISDSVKRAVVGFLKDFFWGWVCVWAEKTVMTDTHECDWAWIHNLIPSEREPYSVPNESWLFTKRKRPSDEVILEERTVAMGGSIKRRRTTEW